MEGDCQGPRPLRSSAVNSPAAEMAWYQFSGFLVFPPRQPHRGGRGSSRRAVQSASPGPRNLVQLGPRHSTIPFPLHAIEEEEVVVRGVPLRQGPAEGKKKKVQLKCLKGNTREKREQTEPRSFQSNMESGSPKTLILLPWGLSGHVREQF